MKVNNALVTYSDLTTMGMIQQLGVNPPIGNQCATKNFILTNYHADEATLSAYTTNRLPPYQYIIPSTVPFVACYNLTIVNNYEPNCNGGLNEYQVWQISLIDQFGNYINASISYTFEITYDYTINTDGGGGGSGTNTVSIVIDPGQYQGFAQFTIYAIETCPYSGVCDGSCNSSDYNINISAVPSGLPGGCSLPAPITDSKLFIPNGFSPNGDGINDYWRFYFLSSSGVLTEMNYASYPNITWTVANRCNTVYYQNLTGGIYSPWNGHLNNDLGQTIFLGSFDGLDACGAPGGGAFYEVHLNDGSGRSATGILTVAV